MTATLLQDLTLLKDAIEAGAEIARSYYLNGARVWDKGRGQGPVTQADLAVDALLQQRLREARPDYGWLSEETADDPARMKAARAWIVDPIDGTRSFIRQRPQWTVCGALIEHNKPVAGVVVNPMTNETFVASIGGGAELNGVAIHVSNPTSLERARLMGPKDFYAHPSWPEPWPETLILDNPGSIAYRLCLIASGARDGTVRSFSCHEWDVAAGDLIVREAGGLMTSLDGGPIGYNKPNPVLQGYIAAGPSLYPELKRRLDLRAGA